LELLQTVLILQSPRLSIISGGNYDQRETVTATYKKIHQYYQIKNIGGDGVDRSGMPWKVTMPYQLGIGVLLVLTDSAGRELKNSYYQLTGTLKQGQIAYIRADINIYNGYDTRAANIAFDNTAEFGLLSSDKSGSAIRTIRYKRDREEACTAYEHKSYRGDVLTIHRNTVYDDLDDVHMPSGGVWDNEISSVKVPAGCTLYAYKDAGFANLYKAWKGPLAYAWTYADDDLESLNCYCY